MIQKRISSINQHDWAQSFFRNKLAMRFFIRSASTVCCKQSEKRFYIFAGFYAPGIHYSSYSFEFRRAIKSLNLKTDLKALIAQYRHDQQTKYNREMISYLQRILMETDEDYYKPLRKKSKGVRIRLLIIFYGVALLFSTFLLYLFWISFANKRCRQKSLQRRRRKRSRRKRRQ